MKNVLAVAAMAGASVVSAQSGCSGNSRDEGGNWFCSPTNNIQFTNFGLAGNYNRVTDMSTPTCASEPQAFSGSVSPLNEEVSLHIRGPFLLKQFAFYTPGSDSGAANQKRSATERRHAHAHAHKHAKKHAHHGDKRDAEPDLKDITAVIDGKTVSFEADTSHWGDAYAASLQGGAAPASAAPASAAAPATAAAAAPAAADSAPATSAKPASGSPFKPDFKGDWVRAAYYNAAAQHAEGVTFLNHMGNEALSGTWDTTFGNSLSYASADGSAAAASPQVLAQTTLTSKDELVLMSDKQCTDGSCGFVRPKSVAYHGFGGDEKIFLFEFQMPHDPVNTAGFNADMPALWMLNAQIPRTLQYGAPTCSCWASGCGELDLFEVLAPQDTKCKATLHANLKGGPSDYFNRPVDASIKAAVVMSNMQATIKIIDGDFDFSTTLSNGDVRSLGSSTGLLGKLLGAVVDAVAGAIPMVENTVFALAA